MRIGDRRLPERSKLQFWFPKLNNNYFIVELPFFENIKVNESRKARYQKYSLISRSANLYTYTGADSRKLSLSFNMNLSHILAESPDVTRGKYIETAKVESGEAAKNLFRGKRDKAPIQQSIQYANNIFKTSDLKSSARMVLYSDWAREGMTDAEKQYLFNFYGLSKDDEDQANKVASVANSAAGAALNALTGIKTQAVTKTQPQQKLSAIDRLRSRKLSKAEEKKFKAIDLIIYWTNIVRASVVNNAKNPVLGPPVLRLQHGVLFQDVPCICTSYKIEFDERAGYDVATLLPRNIKISMELEEFRTGDFAEYDRTQYSKRDNLAGWEAIFEGDGPEIMDPGYLLLNDQGESENG